MRSSSARTCNGGPSLGLLHSDKTPAIQAAIVSISRLRAAQRQGTEKGRQLRELGVARQTTNVGGHANDYINATRAAVSHTPRLKHGPRVAFHKIASHGATGQLSRYHCAQTVPTTVAPEHGKMSATPARRALENRCEVRTGERRHGCCLHHAASLTPPSACDPWHGARESPHDRLCCACEPETRECACAEPLKVDMYVS